MNLALEEGERVTTGGKGRGEIGGEAGEVTGMVADVPTTVIGFSIDEKLQSGNRTAGN